MKHTVAMSPQTVASFPQTIYGVSLVFHDGNCPSHTVVMLPVSGDNPLTAEEVIARAKKVFASNWDAGARGPFEKIQFHGAVYSFVTQVKVPQ